MQIRIEQRSGEGAGSLALAIAEQVEGDHHLTFAGMAGCLPGAAIGGEQRPHLFGDKRDRHYRVAHAPGELERLRRVQRGEVEFGARLLRRPRQRGGVLDRVKAAAMGDVLPAQQQIDLFDPFAEARHRLVGRTAEAALRTQAEEKLDALQRGIDMKNFLIRLAITLPLLVIGGWLFAKHRKNRYWPFVWGFIFFALFAFFVELVPYLPDYGGYVRYVVGVIVTILVGRYSINGLQRYLQNQKSAETLPDDQRRQALSYDVAQSRFAKGICPGCERKVDLSNPKLDFCMHCGISLFDACAFCQTRKNAFAHYCPSCGKEAVAS